MNHMQSDSEEAATEEVRKWQRHFCKCCYVYPRIVPIIVSFVVSLCIHVYDYIINSLLNIMILSKEHVKERRREELVSSMEKLDIKRMDLPSRLRSR